MRSPLMLSLALVVSVAAIVGVIWTHQDTVPGKAAERKGADYHHVASIPEMDPITLMRVSFLLRSKGIPLHCQVPEGSPVVLLVPEESLSAAHEVLLQDAGAGHLSVSFPDGKHYKAAISWRVTKPNESYASALGSAEYPASSSIGATLREVTIADAASEYPSVVRIALAERSYFDQNGERQVGHEVHLRLGGQDLNVHKEFIVQVWDDANEVSVLGERILPANIDIPFRRPGVWD